MSELKFFHLSDTGRGAKPSRGHVVSMVSSRVGDGQLTGFGLFVVAHSEGGTKPAGIVARTFGIEVMRNLYYSTLMDGNPKPESILQGAAKEANQKLRSEFVNSTSSLTAILVVNSSFYLAHVGSSLAYLITQNTLERLTTVVDERALGLGDSAPELEIKVHNLPEQGRLFLCDEELWEDDELANTNRIYATVHDAGEALIETVKSRHEGNFAAILVQRFNDAD